MQSQVLAVGELLMDLSLKTGKEKFFTGRHSEKHPDLKSAFGLDFGYTNDPSALFAGYISS